VLLIFVVVGLSAHNDCLLASSSYNSAKANCRKHNSFLEVCNSRTTYGTEIKIKTIAKCTHHQKVININMRNPNYFSKINFLSAL